MSPLSDNKVTSYFDGKNESCPCSSVAVDDITTELDELDTEMASLGSALTTIFVVYIFIVLLWKVIMCCQFLCAWNFIMKTHRSADSCTTTRSLSLLARSFGARGSPAAICHESILIDECPICLESFKDDTDGGFKRYDYIISCPCGKHFHNECLTMWLERGSSCPCCRRDLIDSKMNRQQAQHHQQHRSWMADLSIFVGFPPR